MPAVYFCVSQDTTAPFLALCFMNLNKSKNFGRKKRKKDNLTTSRDFAKIKHLSRVTRVVGLLAIRQILTFFSIQAESTGKE